MMHTAPLVVVQITDTHLFATPEQELRGCQTARSLEAVLDHVRQTAPRPDLLLLTGDLSQDETAASYQRLHDMLRGFDIPMARIPGNHDHVPLMEQTLQGSGWIRENSFQRSGWNFLLLNSAVVGRTEGQLSDETLAWVDQQLTQRPQMPTLVALHHPPIPIRSDWMDALGLREAEAFLEVLDRHPQVKLVLFGHIHQEFDGQRNGTRFLAAPSSCIQFIPGRAELAIDTLAPGFRRLVLYPDGQFETQVERVPSASLQPVG